MITRKLPVAIVLTGLTLVADAGNPRTSVPTKIIGSSPTNFAPITAADPSTTPPTPGRLRRTDENQPGNEMAHLAFFKDGKSGLFFSASTDLVDPSAPLVSHK